MGMVTEGQIDDENEDTKAAGQDLSGAPPSVAQAMSSRAVGPVGTSSSVQPHGDVTRASSRGQDELAEPRDQPPLRSIISSIR